MFAPLNYTIVNLRPFDIQVYVGCMRVSSGAVVLICVYSGTAIDFVGLIYLLILSFIAAVGIVVFDQSECLEAHPFSSSSRTSKVGP